MVTSEDIKKWKPLVKKISYKYINNPYRLELEDIEQIGYIGLLKGLKSYDKNKNTKLISYLYNHIKWAIDSEMISLKSDKRCTLSNSTSLDISISDDENLTMTDTLIDLKTDILEAITEGFLMLDYKEQIKKTLIDQIDIDIAFKVLFDDLTIEDTAKELGLDADFTRSKYRSIREKLRRNIFIRSRWREYIRSIKEWEYKNIDYYKETERVVFNAIYLEKSLLKLV